MIAKVGLVDDHPTALLGVSAIVNAQQSMRVVGTAGTVEALLSGGSSADIVILDLQLADGSSPRENIQAIHASGALVLIFTSGENPALVREAARAGAAGMLRKSESPERIINALTTALAGETVATPDWAAALVEDREFVQAQLTKREAQVLSACASGLTADQVGAELLVSRDTILDHLRRIRRSYAAVDRPAPTKVDLQRRTVDDDLVPPTNR